VFLKLIKSFVQNWDSAQNALLKQELERKNKVLKNIPRKLKTYLTSIIGFSDLLLEEDHNTLTDKQKYYLNNITISAGLINKSIKDI